MLIDCFTELLERFKMLFIQVVLIIVFCAIVCVVKTQTVHYTFTMLFALASPSGNKCNRIETFDTICRMVLIHSQLLFSII